MKTIVSCWKRGRSRVIAAAALLVLSACASSPSSRFYTLMPAADPPTGPQVTRPSETVEVTSVAVPAQVSRSELVIRSGASEVKVLEQQRWASPLADEIHAAFSAMLSHRLSVTGARNQSSADETTLYRVGLNIQRFESWPGSHVLIDAVWQVHPTNGGRTLSCHSTVELPVTQGYDALAEGHRHALETIADEVVASIRSTQSQALLTCAA